MRISFNVLVINHYRKIEFQMEDMCGNANEKISQQQNFWPIMQKSYFKPACLSASL